MSDTACQRCGHPLEDHHPMQMNAPEPVKVCPDGTHTQYVAPGKDEELSYSDSTERGEALKDLVAAAKRGNDEAQEAIGRLQDIFFRGMFPPPAPPGDAN